MENRTANTCDTNTILWTEVSEDFINLKVQNVHVKYYEHFRSWKIPILIKELVNFMPITVEEIIFSDVPNGKLTISDRGLTIAIPNSFTHVRKRVEAAHELAHILLENELGLTVQENRNISQSNNYKILETLCDKVGRLLLLPEQTLPSIESLAEEPFLSKKILKLAKEYDVTVPCVVMRLLDLANANERLGIKQIIKWSIEDSGKNSKDFQVKAHWHACPGFIPHNNKASKKSTIYKVARIGLNNKQAISGNEDVSIGSLKGRFYVDVFPYAFSRNLGNYSRILSVFRDGKVTEKFNKNIMTKINRDAHS